MQFKISIVPDPGDQLDDGDLVIENRILVRTRRSATMVQTETREQVRDSMEASDKAIGDSDSRTAWDRAVDGNPDDEECN